MNNTIVEWLRRRWVVSVGGAVLLFGSLLGITELTKAENGSAAALQLEAASNTNVVRDGKFLTSFAPLVKRVAPSVVKVSVTVQPKMREAQDSELPDFWRFFGS